MKPEQIAKTFELTVKKVMLEAEAKVYQSFMDALDEIQKELNKIDKPSKQKWTKEDYIREAEVGR